MGFADVATKRDLEQLEARLEARLLATLHAELHAQTRAMTRMVLLASSGSVLTVAGLAFAAARLV